MIVMVQFDSEVIALPPISTVRRTIQNLRNSNWQ